MNIKFILTSILLLSMNCGMLMQLLPKKEKDDKKGLLFPLALIGMGNRGGGTQPPPPLVLTYPTTTPISVQVGQQLTLSPSLPVTGATYAITPTLPAGLTLNPTTGVISGTPTGQSPATQYSITQTSPSGAVVTWVITLGVIAPTTGGSSSVATPTFSPTPGHFTTGQTITISTTTAGATIYYTTNGDTPTTASTLYATSVGHIWSLAGKTLKAIAIKSGSTDSAVATAEYSYSVLKTGQTTSYVAGDDGASQLGTIRSYTDNGNGTVTDNATGLLWQKCSLGQTGGACAGGAATTPNWATTQTDCSILTTAGKTWRLPSSIELETLPNYGASNPSINTGFFPATVALNSWSSTTYALNASRAWIVNFNDGVVTSNNKPNNALVRCVSGP